MGNRKSLEPKYKVRQNGPTGAMITLDQDWREAQGVKLGDYLLETYAPDGVSLQLTPIKKADPS